MKVKFCWRDLREGNKKECVKAECCYRATELSVFDYWKFANGEKWRKMVERELEKEVNKNV